jgi:predicted transposase YdaD
VVRIWEQPPSVFLQHPGLLPFATLGDTLDPEATLRQVAIAVDQITDPTTQSNISAASAILAGLKCEDDIIYQILRRDIMQESSVYRSIFAEGKGIGVTETQRSIALNFLRDGLSIETIARGTGLSLEEVQQLQQELNVVPSA